AAVIAMGQMLTTPRSNRFFVLWTHVLAFIVPFGLIGLGVYPHHSELLTPRLLVFTSIVGVAIMSMAARYAARYRDELAAAHTRNALQTWQLRRLVPDRASAPPPNGAFIA